MSYTISLPFSKDNCLKLIFFICLFFHVPIIDSSFRFFDTVASIHSVWPNKLIHLSVPPLFFFRHTFWNPQSSCSNLAIALPVSANQLHFRDFFKSPPRFLVRHLIVPGSHVFLFLVYNLIEVINILYKLT